MQQPRAPTIGEMSDDDPRPACSPQKAPSPSLMPSGNMDAMRPPAMMRSMADKTAVMSSHVASYWASVECDVAAPSCHRPALGAVRGRSAGWTRREQLLAVLPSHHAPARVGAALLIIIRCQGRSRQGKARNGWQNSAGCEDVVSGRRARRVSSLAMVLSLAVLVPIASFHLAVFHYSYPLHNRCSKRPFARTPIPTHPVFTQY